MIAQTTANFFLSNVNEPVALEIPLNSEQREDISQIKEALEKVGLDVGFGGIEITQSGSDAVVILTPVMHPNDLHALYDLVSVALKQINRGTRYPYVRDIKYLPKIKRESKESISDVADEMIRMAMASGEHKTFSRSTKDISHGAFIEKMQKTGHLFAGSTISDPYTVASDLVRRDTRMATDKSSYALGYSVGDKGISGHEQRSGRGFRYGFFYEYERNPKQPFFQNTGIEYGHEPGYSTSAFQDNETPVNRFTNPCVAQWFVWYDDIKQIYNVYKIPENDSKWKDLLSKLPTVMHYDSPQINWINRLSKMGDEPHSVVKGIEPGQLSQYADEKIKEIIANRMAEEKRKEEINNKIDLLNKNVKEIQNIVDTMNASSKPAMYGAYKYDEKISVQQDGLKYLSQSYEKLDALEAKFGEIKKHVNDIKQEYGDDIKFEDKLEDLTRKLRDLDESMNKYRKSISIFKDNVLNMNIDYNLDKMVENQDAVSIDDLRQLRPEHKLDLMKKLFEYSGRHNLKLAITLYSVMSKDVQRDAFKYFYDFVLSKKNAADWLKEALKNVSVDIPSEIRELSRGKNLFVNHIERARKNMLLKSGVQKLKQYDKPVTIVNNKEIG